MPQIGDDCDGTESVGFSDDHELLVCRNGTWQAISDPPPLTGGVLPSREAARRIVEDHFGAIDDPGPTAGA